MTNLLLPIGLFLIVSCSQKTIESAAKSDSQKKLTRIINNKAIKSSSPGSQIELNKIKDLISNQCPKSSKKKHLGTYKGFDDLKNKMVFIEYVSCKDIWTLWSYKIQENHPELLGVWIDKLENREKNISKFLASESWE